MGKRIFIDDQEMASKGDLDQLNGDANEAFSDNPNNHLKTGIYEARPTADGIKDGFPSNRWSSFLVFRTADKVLQVKGDDTGEIYIRSCSTDQDVLNIKKFHRIATDNDIQSLQDQINQLKS
jgi:hypothetical protein|nr:MAG TPA: hypothetical protein [Caudoviricetes sp.]